MCIRDRSNKLARHLTARGVARETLVPICLDRSLEMIVGILGILKAGGAYVPIDPDYPGERISYMLEDTNASMVITNSKIKEKFSSKNIKIIELDTDWLLISKRPLSNTETNITADQLAYVIY